MKGGGFFGDYIILRLADSEKLLVNESIKTVMSILPKKSLVQYVSDKEDDVLPFRGLEIYPSKYRVCRDANDLEVSAHEFEILLLLAASAGRVFSKEQIYEAVWKQEAFNCENTVMCCISQLRKKIEINPRKPKYIQTVRGVGYKFVAPEE